MDGITILVADGDASQIKDFLSIEEMRELLIDEMRERQSQADDELAEWDSISELRADDSLDTAERKRLELPRERCKHPSTKFTLTNTCLFRGVSLVKPKHLPALHEYFLLVQSLYSVVVRRSQQLA
ncbi:hypothetical protein [Halobacterium sp. BOL4-2]|uniref:hypothetical protein n=1 Tax=Halobacterium sp. BOL4-2 TaxID=2810537 RepID=UPI0019648B46|nr:hypothetical protein [Halobacterium sp. BOL4-2]QRY23977.1 hypothetical protein JRZ79_06030 [Halobacterium sp. BOL4-2]